MQKTEFPKITEEALTELKSRIGEEVRAPQPWLEEASKDAIRHYAHGIGDRNPLYLDETYAEKTRYKGIIAPPSILYAFDRIVSGYVGGLPGVHAMYSGTDWNWKKPIYRNDKIESKSILKDLIEHRSQFSEVAIQQIYETTFTNQRGEIVAIADSWCFRTQRSVAREKGKYKRIEPHVYNDEEINQIIQDYAKEEIRGAEPRYWEDVNIGDKLVPVVKGPLTPTSCIAYAQGWGGLYIRAHAYAFEMYQKHPALGIKNYLNIPEPPERVHWDTSFAQTVGVPEAYDYGPERVSWLSHLVTNWMGDDAFLKRLYAEVRRFNIMGDTHWCKGQITKKEVVDGEHLVTIDVYAEDQRGEQTAKGYAVVQLPSRTNRNQ